MPSGSAHAGWVEEPRLSSSRSARVEADHDDQDQSGPSARVVGQFSEKGSGQRRSVSAQTPPECGHRRQIRGGDRINFGDAETDYAAVPGSGGERPPP